MSFKIRTYTYYVLIVAIALTATACQPKASPARGDSEPVTIPNKIELNTEAMKSNGDDRKQANARALIGILAEIEDIETHVMSHDLAAPEERKNQMDSWRELPQTHKNVVTQVLSQCKINKNQTKPDLEHLKPGAQFVFASDFHTDGSECPVKLSRVTSNHAKVLSWDTNNQSGSYRLKSTVKAINEFHTASHQSVMGYKQGEWDMSYTQEVVIEPDKSRRSYVRASGTGFVLTSNPVIGRIDLRFSGQELNLNGQKTTVVEFHMIVNKESYTFAFETEGAQKRVLKKAFIGSVALDQDHPDFPKILKFANQLSLSIN